MELHMSRIKKPILNEKHLKALGLIEAGEMSLKDMAAQCGWKEDYLYELTSGDTSKAGEVASFFKAEYKKIGDKKNAKIRLLLKSNTALAHQLIQKQLRFLDSKKDLSIEERKLVATYMNAIAKATPNVQIDNLSYSYTKGYTPEQMIYEFKRLQTLAGSSSNRSAVQGSEEGGPGDVPGAASEGDRVARFKEITGLRTPPETGSVS